MGTFNMVVNEDGGESFREEFDVEEVVSNPKFRNMIESNSVDLGDGKKAFCIDMSTYRELFIDVCPVDVEAGSKDEMECNPLGWVADKLGMKKDDVVEKDEGKKYCLIYDDGIFEEKNNIEGML